MRRALRLILLVLLPAGVPEADALPPGKAARMVGAARELVGVRYEFGARLQGPDAGVDCQGVLFYAAERVQGCGWRSFSVFPTKMVRWGELGAPVPGLAPVATASLDVSRLEAGDVILFVSSVENPAEPAIGRLDGGPVWVWHTGLFAGDGGVIEADIPQVVETDLLEYLQATPAYDGVFVVRMGRGPAPRTCRKHPPMRIQ